MNAMEQKNKMVIYQVFPRWFGNLRPSPVMNGSLAENGVGKFSAFTPLALSKIKELGVTHVWYTGVIEHAGHLTDHYNPANQTVNLSESVYYSNSIAAAAVAAHECGHAVQHATAYAPLRMRSALVPVVSFASNIMTWVLLGGMLLLHTFPQLLLFGIILFATTTLFSFITLPRQYFISSRELF